MCPHDKHGMMRHRFVVETKGGRAFLLIYMLPILELVSFQMTVTVSLHASLLAVNQLIHCGLLKLVFSVFRGFWLYSSLQDRIARVWVIQETIFLVGNIAYCKNQLVKEPELDFQIISICILVSPMRLMCLSYLERMV